MQNLELNSWPSWPIRGVKVAWRSPLWIIRRFALFVALKATGMASYVMQRLVAGVRATQVAWKLEATTASRVRCGKERGTGNGQRTVQCRRAHEQDKHVCHQPSRHLTSSLTPQLSPHFMAQHMWSTSIEGTPPYVAHVGHVFVSFSSTTSSNGLAESRSRPCAVTLSTARMVKALRIMQTPERCQSRVEESQIEESRQQCASRLVQ